MKKTIMGLSMVMLTCLLVVSCQKETIKKTNLSKQLDEKENIRNPQQIEPMEFTISTGSSCGDLIPCAIGGISPLPLNSIVIVKTLTTSVLYPNLRYTYYLYSHTTGTVKYFTPFAQYICNSNTVKYASASLPNNKEIYVLANVPSYNAPTGNLAVDNGNITNVGTNWGGFHGMTITTTSPTGSCPGGGIAGL